MHFIGTAWFLIEQNNHNEQEVFLIKVITQFKSRNYCQKLTIKNVVCIAVENTCVVRRSAYLMRLKQRKTTMRHYIALLAWNTTIKQQNNNNTTTNNSEEAPPLVKHQSVSTTLNTNR